MPKIVRTSRFHKLILWFDPMDSKEELSESGLSARYMQRY